MEATALKVIEGGGNKVDVASILKGARSATSTAAKSKVPLLSVSLEVSQLATMVRDLLNQVDSAKAMLEVKGAELETEVRPMRETYCLDKGFTSSVKVPTLDGATLTMTFSSNYTKCGPEQEDLIVQITGPERFGKYFNVLNSIKVKSDVTQDELADLIGRVGPEDFGKFFSVEANIKPNERFKTEQFSAFTPDERRDLEDAGIRAYKPAIKK